VKEISSINFPQHGEVFYFYSLFSKGPPLRKQFILHTYHSRFILKGVAEASQIFETPTFYQNYFAMRNTADVTGGKPIAVWSHSILGVRCKCYKSFSRFFRHPWKKERGAILLFCPEHHIIYKHQNGISLIYLWYRYHHHQPINAPTAGAQAFLMDYMRRTGHNHHAGGVRIGGC
jgi:hypothetical protein